MSTKLQTALRIIFLLLISLWLHSCRQHTASTAIINWIDVRQPIDGFGASTADFLDSLTPAQADFFFTPSGIGLSILRTQIIPDQATCDAEFHKNGCSESNGQILNGELGTARLAVARGAIVFSTPWSPPSLYKTNGTFTNGGSLLSAHYSDWAKKIATYVSMMTSHGVPIYAVSLQNEPDLATSYGSCTYNSQQIHDFVPFLYSALQSAGAGSTKIMIAEQSSWAIDLTSDTMSDSRIAPRVGIVAAHGYGGKIQPFRTGNARLWQTEISSQSPIYDGSMTDGLGWAQKIHEYLTVANVNAWVWWFLTDMPRQGEGTDNAALTNIKGDLPKRTFVIGQWSKFVRPGWSRIGVTYSGALRISAFKDPKSESFAIVVVNPSSQPVRETLSLEGFAANTLNPWITSASQSLALQPSLPVSGANFTYLFSASSVTTFSGRTSRAP